MHLLTYIYTLAYMYYYNCHRYDHKHEQYSLGYAVASLVYTLS